MGKKNITVVEQEGVEAYFRSKKKTLLIKLKQELIEKISENMRDEDIPHELVEELEKAEITSIFEIRSITRN